MKLNNEHVFIVIIALSSSPDPEVNDAILINTINVNSSFHPALNIKQRSVIFVRQKSYSGKWDINHSLIIPNKSCHILEYLATFAEKLKNLYSSSN